MAGTSQLGATTGIQLAETSSNGISALGLGQSVELERPFYFTNTNSMQISATYSVVLHSEMLHGLSGRIKRLQLY